MQYGLFWYYVMTTLLLNQQAHSGNVKVALIHKWYTGLGAE